MEALTKYEVLLDFAEKVLYTMKDLAYKLYEWLLAGVEFDIPNIDGGVTHYTLTGLDFLGAFAVTWFLARLIASIVDTIIPN